MDVKLAENIRNEIIMHAKRRRTIDYLMIRLVIADPQVDDQTVEEYLEYISRHDHQQQMPILWAIAVTDSGEVSPNFYSLLKELELVDAQADAAKLKRTRTALIEEAFVYWTSRRRSGKKRFKPKKQ